MLSPYDGLSRRHHHRAAERRLRHRAAKPLPIVTGQDAEIASVKSIIDGVQYSTIFKDTRQLAEQAVDDGRRRSSRASKPEVNDTKTYDNGVKVVPSYLLESVIVDKDNIQKALVDSGYYSRGGRRRVARPTRSRAGASRSRAATAPPPDPCSRSTPPARPARRGRRTHGPTTSWRCATSPRPSPA